MCPTKDPTELAEENPDFIKTEMRGDPDFTKTEMRGAGGSRLCVVHSRKRHAVCSHLLPEDFRDTSRYRPESAWRMSMHVCGRTSFAFDSGSIATLRAGSKGSKLHVSFLLVYVSTLYFQ